MFQFGKHHCGFGNAVHHFATHERISLHVELSGAEDGRESCTDYQLQVALFCPCKEEDWNRYRQVDAHHYWIEVCRGWIIARTQRFRSRQVKIVQAWKILNMWKKLRRYLQQFCKGLHNSAVLVVARFSCDALVAICLVPTGLAYICLA